MVGRRPDPGVTRVARRMPGLRPGLHPLRHPLLESSLRLLVMSNPRRCFATLQDGPKPTPSSGSRATAMEQLCTKHGFIRRSITKGISAIDCLRSYEGKPVRVLHQHLEFVLAKQAALIEFDRAESIHRNDSLSKTDTFKYRVTYLSGSAKTAIQNIRLAEANYDAAIKVLSDRFGCRDMLDDDHPDHLLAMAPIRSSADLDKLRNLYDKITFHTSAPEGLDVSPD
ncbi:hypothetical protein HPB49_002861 [Dermacentor silvarum]|uniref:Uncharacterized protein n=1 Tax=Dermacentor silvarum TaxID=543639 RepID=A0ACB8CJD8_DERSI|nr:hypothetical protein HPB49_002861 [Dermacentor silvarum]